MVVVVNPDREALINTMRNILFALWDVDEVVTRTDAKNWIKQNEEYAAYFKAYLLQIGKPSGANMKDLNKVIGQIMLIKKKINTARIPDGRNKYLQKKIDYKASLSRGLRVGLGPGKW